MKTFFFSLFFAAMFLLTSCAVTNKAKNNSTILDDAFLRKNGSVNTSVKGYWQSIGNGYILDASTDSILLYSYTKNFCYKEKNDYIEGQLNSKARFTKRNDTINVYPTDFGDKSNILQIKNDYIRIHRLPDNYLTFKQMQQLGPKKLFLLFIETMQENYAFSTERKLNWDLIRTEFAPKISDSTTTKELFNYLGQIVTLTKDQHTKIIAEDGRTLQYTITPAAELVTEAFKKQSAVKKLDDYFKLFFTTNYKNISDSLLNGKGEKVANGKIEWGNLTNNVGYIHIHSFSNFAPSGFSRKQQIDSINYHMERIVNAFKDKKSIVVDISFNFGGFDAAVLTMASYFTDKRKIAYTSQVYTNGTYYDESLVYLQPASKVIYTKPVYVLMTDISRSAAEGFAVAMRANKNVKLAGTNTLGILSSMLGKSIGTFYATSSNQRLLLPTGKQYEVTGVEPDLKMAVFDTENVLEAHKNAVRKLVQFIEKQ